MIELSHVSFSYPNKDILKDVTHAFSGSSILMGKNGSGKSTLLKIMAGIQKPTSGTVKHHIQTTWQPATSHLQTSLKVDEFLEIYFDGSTQKELEEAKDFLKNFFGFSDLKKAVNQCSSGEIQMILLSCSLHKKSDLILLDEPLSYLDTKTKMKAARYLKNLNTPIVMTSHESWLLWSIFEHCTLLKDSSLINIETKEHYLHELKSMTGITHQVAGSFILPSEGI